MSEDKKSYNILAMMGNDMDDMEYVKDFGLDPAVAYTPAINDAMLDVVYKQNVDALVEEGMSHEEATTKAKRARASAHQNIRDMMKIYK